METTRKRKESADQVIPDVFDEKEDQWKLLPENKEEVDECGVECWVLFLAQLTYLAGRSFAIAAPLTLVLEIASTLAIVFALKWRLRSHFLLRIVVLACALVLYAFIQYVFDLTYIAGIAALYLYFVYLFTFALLLLVPAPHVKIAMALSWAALTAMLYNSGIFTEPWVLLVLTINWVAVIVMMYIVPYITYYGAVLLFFVAWIVAMLVYYYGFNIRNDQHHLSQYF